MISICIFSIYLLVTAAAYKVEPYESYGWAQINMYSCAYQLMNTATFTEEPDFYASCSSKLALASMAGCMSNGGPLANPHELMHQCLEYYNSTITEEDWETAFANYTSSAMKPEDIPGFNLTVPVDVPIILDPEMRKVYLKSYSNYLGERTNTLYYGSALLGFWLLVFILAAISHWSKLMLPGVVNNFTGPFSNFWRRQLTMAALGGRSRTQEKYLWFIGFLAPSRMETLIVSLFVVLVIVVNATIPKYVKGDPLWESQSEYYGQFIGCRTGVDATMLTPLLVLFAGRNNFLQWITGLNYSVFITYHKWVSRVVFLLVVAHASAYTVEFGATYTEQMKENYVIWGTIATVSAGIILFQSLLFFRRRWYEVFLIIHITLAALFVAGSYVHVAILGYAWFYYACFAVWVLDRVVRIGRLIHFGCPKATVTLLPNETLKMTVRRPKYWNAVPGGHAFIHFIRPSCFWQSHPFTFTVSGESGEITMYCKVKGGVTHGLYQYLSTHPGKTAQIRVCLEGPYGGASPVDRYSTAVFIAGGNGIPGLYSEVLDLALRSNETCQQKLKLYWTIRDYQSLLWFHDELLALKDTKVECIVNITRPELMISSDNSFTEQLTDHFSSEKEKKANNISFKEKDCEKDWEQSLSNLHTSLSHVKFSEGRPCLDKLIKNEVEESSGSIAFVACGNPIMVDEVRYNSIQALDSAKGKRIDFFEQLQVWA